MTVSAEVAAVYRRYDAEQLADAVRRPLWTTVSAAGLVCAGTWLAMAVRSPTAAAAGLLGGMVLLTWLLACTRPERYDRRPWWAWPLAMAALGILLLSGWLIPAGIISPIWNIKPQETVPAVYYYAPPTPPAQRAPVLPSAPRPAPPAPASPQEMPAPPASTSLPDVPVQPASPPAATATPPAARLVAPELPRRVVLRRDTAVRLSPEYDSLSFFVRGGVTVAVLGDTHPSSIAGSALWHVQVTDAGCVPRDTASPEGISSACLDGWVVERDLWR